MDKTLGLLDGGGGGGLGVKRMENDYMGGLSSEASSYTNEAEIELGLGLGLRSSGGGVGKGKGKGASAWGEFGRILTAQDLLNGLSVRASGGVSGTKRAADDCVSHVDNNGPSSAAVSQVVGWPPIGTYRMNNLVNQSKIPNIEEKEDKGLGVNEKNESSKKKTNCQNHRNDDDILKEKGQVGFVKVNVDGLGIGRKVDMNAHASYESLAQALVDMFFVSSPTTDSTNCEKEHARQPPPKLLDESSEFVLTYEDKEGDWMLVGDVPWGMFICTVKRLRIMRTSEANAIAPILQEKHERQKGMPARMQER